MPFVKMHGLGNDFMVINGETCSVSLTAERLQRWSDRHCGVGFDQLLCVSPSKKPGIDFDYVIYNADGSRVGQCGNGVRCAAQFAFRCGLTAKTAMVMETDSITMAAEILPSGHVRVDLGKPSFDPRRLPFLAQWPVNADGLYCPDGLASGFNVGVVSMGNPHAVIMVDDLDATPVQDVGQYLEKHPQFPERVNVGFAQRINAASLRLRVYERGAGETQACGSGACAAMAEGRRRGLLDQSVRVDMRGGQLQVEWDGSPDASLFMTGPAEFVYEGYVWT
ncbi:MAG: diaminopimelate epimerase [Gammaproteobacteria bacterium]